MNSDLLPNHCGILFVDDEEKSRKYFARLFGNTFQVFTAGSVDEAERLLDVHMDAVGILVTDQRMPGAHGVDLLDMLRQRRPDVVRILTTAYADLDSAMDAVNRGEIFRLVTKPWDIASLREDLEAACLIHQRRRQEQLLLEERRRTMLLLAANIAHELRTPLLSIRSASAGLAQYLPRLLDGYDYAIKHGADLPPLRSNQISGMSYAVESITREVDRSNTVIDVLLANAREDGLQNVEARPFSMQACIIEALERYPFEPHQRERVAYLGDADFTAFGSQPLFVYVLFNLIKNALQAIASKGQGEITIRAETGEPFNRIRFRDTGGGIDPDKVALIFEDFFTTRGELGMGIGLPFCRRVLHRFGGNIFCESQFGEFAEFVLTLPLVTEHDSVGTETS